MPERVELHSDRLHRSVRDPVFGSIGFLNEIMTRYPTAISFAPGAPHLPDIDEHSLQDAIETYLQFEQAENGLSRVAARRKLVEYGPSAGLITTLIARTLSADHGIDVAPDAVVITVGAQEGFLLALRALLSTPADVLGVVTPCFVGIRGAASFLDIPTVSLPESEHGLDPELVRIRCAQLRTQGQRMRALYVAPDFANPTGHRMPRATRHALLAVAAEEDLILLEDNAYAFTANDPLPLLKSLDTTGRVVLVSTFSKVFLPGVRVGFVVADQTVTARSGAVRSLAAELALLKGMVTVNTAAVSQAIVAGMLLSHGGSLAESGRAHGAHYRSNLTLLLGALELHLGDLRRAGEVAWTNPDGGFFVVLTCAAELTDDELNRSAEFFGVLWTPMDQFCPDGDGRTQMRLSCSYLTATEIDLGITRLSSYLRSFSNRQLPEERANHDIEPACHHR